MIKCRDALRLDPSATDEMADLVQEFSRITDVSLQDSARLLEWTLETDRLVKMNRDKEVDLPSLSLPIDKDARHMMLWITHRFRAPGQKRAKQLEFAYEAIKKHEDTKGYRTVIDFGGGGGNDAIVYGKNGFQVVCADLPSGVQDGYIRKRFEVHGVDCTLEDASTLSGDRKFDVMHNMDMIEHVYDTEGVLAQMLSLLRDGGLLLMEEDCFNVTYLGCHLEKNRFYYKHIDSLLAGYLRRVGSHDRLMVFKKERGDGLSVDDIRADLCGRTLRRAGCSLLVLYPFILLTPLEAVFWKLCRLCPGPLARIISLLIRRDLATVQENLPNYLYKRENYLIMDRFSDGVACFRIAFNNLRKIRAKRLA